MLRHLLLLPLCACCALAGPLEKLEADLAAGHLVAVIEKSDRLLKKESLPPVEKAAVSRVAAMARGLRLDVWGAIESQVDAVELDPDFAGNVALVNDIEDTWMRHGLGSGTGRQLERLLAASEGRPELGREVLYARALERRIAGDFEAVDSLLSELAPPRRYWMAGSYANLAGSGYLRLEDPERGVVDLDATWTDQHGRPSGWRRVESDLRFGVDLDMQLAEDSESCAILLTQLRSEVPVDGRLHVSGSGRFRVWLNGRPVLEMAESQTGGDPTYVLPAHFDAGWNRILVKGCAEQDPLSVVLHATAADGSPLALEDDPDPALWQGPAATDAAAPRGLAAWDPTAWLARLHADADLGLADRFLLGYFLHQRGFLDEGAALIDADERRWPGALTVDVLRNILLDGRQRSTEAAQRRIRQCEQFPELLAARVLEPKRLLDENDTEGFLRVTKELQRLLPDDPTVLVYGAITGFFEGRAPDAIAELGAALESRPGELELSQNLQDLFEGIQDEDGRQAEVRRVALARPDMPDLSRRASLDAFRRDQPDEALQWLELAWKASGRTDNYHAESAFVQQRAGRFEEALASAERGLAISPGSLALLDLRANLLERLERQEEALEARRRQLVRDPFNDGLRNRIRLMSGGPPPFDGLPEMDREAILGESLDWVPDGAGAVYLLEAGDFRVHESGAMDRRYHVIVRVTGEAGLEDFRTMDFGGEVEIARTLKADGRRIEADRQENSVAFAELEVGDAVELRTLDAFRPVKGLPGEFWTRWHLERKHPVAHGRVAFLLPRGMETIDSLHDVALEPREFDVDEDWRALVYETRRMAGLPVEPDQVGGRASGGWLDISTVSDWSRIVDWYDGVIAGRLEPCPEIEALAARLGAGAEDDSTRARRATHHVMTNVRYEGEAFVNGGYVPRPVRETLRTGYGDCKDQAVLLTGLLRAMGLRADVALVNGRRQAARAYLPSTRFSHAIVRAQAADGRVWWIDPTAEYLSFPNVPVQLEGQSALVVDDRGTGFERIPLDAANARSTTAELEATIDATGDLRVRGRIGFEGEEAASMRSFLALNGPDAHEKRVNDIVCEDYAGARYHDFAFHSGGLDDPVEMEFDYTLPGAVVRAAGMLLVIPPWSANDVPEKLAALEERRTPLDVSAWRGRYEESVDFVLPEGARLLEDYAPVVHECSVGRYELRQDPAGEGRLRLTRVFEIDSLQVESEDYAEFRRMLTAAWKTEKERVVLKLAD